MIEQIPFGNFLWEWTQNTRDEFEKIIRNKPWLTATARTSLQRWLIHRLSDICTPVLCTELDILVVSFGLIGETYQTLYPKLMRDLCKDAHSLTQHPSLILQMEKIQSFWLHNVAIILDRLEKDWPLLENTFNDGQSLGSISDIDSSLSDPH